MGTPSSIIKAAIRERLTHDLGPLRTPLAASGYAAARLLLSGASLRRRAKGFALLMRLHSSAFSPLIDRSISEEVRRATFDERRGRATGLFALYDRTIEEAVHAFRTSPNSDPTRIIGSHLLVVKSATPRERGVIVVDYSNHFPLLPGLFDLAAIAERYTIVLEPSWAGICSADILLYTRLPHVVAIETIEPRDVAFLESLDMNLKSVPVAANWWVDPREAPHTGVNRDIDVIMIAAWSDIKRHWRVFRALSELRRRGRRLKVVLVGYRYDRTKAEIEGLAEYFGIRDQIEAYEYISQEEVNALLVRSKIHVLWSRRECANRAIIEAMMADVPVIVREGLTFGFRYPYINDQTGRFVSEARLADAILEMIENRDRYSPRAWVLEHMTCQMATATLERALRDLALAAGETWTTGLAVKTSTLYAQRYFNPEDESKFEMDYRFIADRLIQSTAWPSTQEKPSR